MGIFQFGYKQQFQSKTVFKLLKQIKHSKNIPGKFPITKDNDWNSCH